MQAIGQGSHGPDPSNLIKRALMIALAGVVLLLLLQLHGGVVRKGLRLFGVVEGMPTVVAVRDGCGHTQWFPAALRLLQDAGGEPLRSDCEAPADVLVLVPDHDAALLFANGRLLSDTGAVGPFTTFRGALLRQGLNRLRVAGVGEKLSHPLPVTSLGEAWGEVLFDTAAGEYLQALAFQTPQQVMFTVGKAAEPITDDTPHPRQALARSLALRRQAADNSVEVLADGCVPVGHELVAQARSGSLLAPQFVARLFNTAVMSPPLPVLDAAWKDLSAYAVHVDASRSDCIRLVARYQVPKAQVYLIAQDFLSQPTDVLAMQGFSGEGTRRPDREEGDRRLWFGRAEGGGFGDLVFVHSQGFDITSLALGGGGLEAEPEATLGGAGTATPVPTAAQVVAARQVSGERPSGLFPALKDLRELLPKAWDATLWGLAAAAPVALILWALGRHAPELAGNARAVRARAAVVALLAFMLAFAVQPLLLQMLQIVLANLGGAQMLGLRPGQADMGSDLSAPIALCVVMMILPILHGTQLAEERRHHRWLAAGAAVVAGLLVVCGVFILKAGQFLLVPDIAQAVVEALPEGWWPKGLPAAPEHAGPLVLAVLIGAWFVLGLLLLWLAVYWFFREAVPRAAVASAAFKAGLLLFLLPLPHAMAEASQVVVGAMASAQQWQFLGLAGAVSAPIRQVPAWVSVAFVLVVVYVILRAFSAVAVATLTQEQALRFTQSRWAGKSVLVVLALAIVMPVVGGIFERPHAMHTVTFRLMTVFMAYGALLALLAPLALAQEFDRQLPADAERALRFRLPKTMLWLATAAFAGYLTLWNREPLPAAVLMATGWALLRWRVLRGWDEPLPAPAAEIAPEFVGPPRPPELAAPSLGKRLVEHLSESRLLQSRRGALEKLFAEGKLAASSLATQRVELDKLQRRIDTVLGMRAAEAKRALFELGPGASPLRNGVRGAVAGLVAAVVFQLLLPFDLSGMAAGQGANKPGWTGLVAEIVVDPRYQVVATSVGDSRLLVFVGELLNAVSIWAIAGFLFGYLFHHIRGRDGFAKAATFGAAVAVPYILSHALVAPPGGVPLAAVSRVVPLFVFLLVVGALVFDGATLRRERVSLAKLPEIYGLRTSVGYLSFAGALAAVQPLLELLDWVMK